MLKENFLSILEAILGKKYFIDFLGFSNPHISKRVKYFLTLFLPDILFANVCNKKKPEGLTFFLKGDC
jgi:hypothetical protein